MTEANTILFAAAARAVCDEARRLGLAVIPSFRSPPRVPGVDRTIRSRAGWSTVAVAIRGRPMVAVVADLIEGVVVANGLSPREAVRARGAMWAAAQGHLEEAA